MGSNDIGHEKRYGHIPFVLIVTIDEFEMVEEMVKKKAAKEKLKTEDFPGEFIAVWMLPEFERARAEWQQVIKEKYGR